MNKQKIALGGGCHWCTEAVFKALRGVENVEQGFVKSASPNESFSEAVIVTYDTGEIQLRELLEVHLRTHASTSNHSMRGKYRSAVYTYDQAQADLVRRDFDTLQPEFDAPLVTQILPFVEFKPSLERFQNYREKNANGQFCKTYIDPKLNLIRQKFATLAKSS